MSLNTLTCANLRKAGSGETAFHTVPETIHSRRNILLSTIYVKILINAAV